MTVALTEKENLWRTIKRKDPDHVPVRRMDGVIPGMVKVYYHGCRMTEAGIDRWGVKWEGASAIRAGSRRGLFHLSCGAS